MAEQRRQNHCSRGRPHPRMSADGAGSTTRFHDVSEGAQVPALTSAPRPRFRMFSSVFPTPRRLRARVGFVHTPGSGRGRVAPEAARRRTGTDDPGPAVHAPTLQR